LVRAPPCHGGSCGFESRQTRTIFNLFIQNKNTMININFGSNFILGLFVSLVGVGLYSIRFLNPKVSEEKDIFFSTLFLLYSGIIIIHGWRLDPILFFSQVLIVFLSLSFFSENINLRVQLLKQKKRISLKKDISEKSIDNLSFVEDTEEESLDIFQIFK
jgi:hypothetical protein